MWSDGNNYKNVNAPDQCRQICDQDPQCVGFTRNNADGTCYLRKDMSETGARTTDWDTYRYTFRVQDQPADVQIVNGVKIKTCPRARRPGRSARRRATWTP